MGCSFQLCGYNVPVLIGMEVFIENELCTSGLCLNKCGGKPGGGLRVPQKGCGTFGESLVNLCMSGILQGDSDLSFVQEDWNEVRLNTMAPPSQSLEIRCKSASGF